MVDQLAKVGVVIDVLLRRLCGWLLHLQDGKPRRHKCAYHHDSSGTLTCYYCGDE